MYVLNAMRVQVPMEIRRRHHVPWSWSYRQLRAAWHGYWDLNMGSLKKQQARIFHLLQGFLITPLRLVSTASCIYVSVRGRSKIIGCITLNKCDLFKGTNTYYYGS